MKARTRRKMLSTVLDMEAVDRRVFNEMLRNRFADTALRAVYRWCVGLRKRHIIAKVSFEKEEKK